MDFDNIVKLTNIEVKYKPLPKYPAITRDIALVVDENVMVGELEKIIKDNGNGLVERIILFDIYRGNDVVNNIQNAIIKEMESQFMAKLRS